MSDTSYIYYISSIQIKIIAARESELSFFELLLNCLLKKTHTHKLIQNCDLTNIYIYIWSLLT